jgi:diacylglycerol kinase family enzyme
MISSPDLVQRVAEVLQPELHPTTRPEHATEIAARCARDGASLVIALGGDGTINEVANGLVGTSTPMAVLPGGTANVLACELGIPRDPVKAARQLSSWVAQKIPAGRLTTADQPPRHFLLMAGAGLDAEVLRNVKPDVKRRLGKAAYWIEGLKMTGRRLRQLEVRAEGQSITTGFALISRVRNYGGDLTIASGASLFSDQFQVVTFAGSTTWPYTAYLGGAVFGKALSVPGVRALHTRRIELLPGNGSQPYPTQMDGEAAGLLPAIIELIPDAITLLVPPTALHRK